VRTPAYENVLFTILPRQALGAAGNPAPRYIQQPGMEFSSRAAWRHPSPADQITVTVPVTCRFLPNNQYPV
jgi:hypothetical protein